MQKDEIDPDEGTLAGAILDGEAIDWTLIESSASGDERRVLNELRFLSTIADLHRQLPSDHGTDSERRDAKVLAAGAHWGRRTAVAVAAVGLALTAMTAATWWFPGSRPGTSVKPLRIAVLPFSMEGVGDDTDMLRDGMTEDVSTRMARFDNVRVISKASAASVSAMKLTMQDIGVRLGVDAIVTGRLRVTNDNVIVATKVIRASDARELWTAEFVRPSAGMLELQHDMAAAIADALNLRRQNAGHHRRKLDR